jgi:cytochrome c oxidase subunit 2
MNEVLELFRLLFNLPPGASTVADEIDWLHFSVISVTMVMSAYVFGAVFWFTVRWHRKRAGQLTERVEATRLHEGLIITGVLVTFVLWWVIGFRQYTKMTTAPPDAQTVYVDAKQWMWKFVYADDTLTVPVGKPIKLVMTSRDVIHSFYVPSFRLKQDVIPGRYVALSFTATKPGRYPIWCAEYCGVSHSNMHGEVVVLSAEDYARWSQATVPPGGLAARGKEVATKRQCVACHTLDGQRHVGPSFRGLYGSQVVLSDGRHVLADEAYLTRSMMEPNVEVVDGFKPVMPSYQGTLTPAEAGALVELIKSLREESGQASGVALPTLTIEGDGGAP